MLAASHTTELAARFGRGLLLGGYRFTRRRRLRRKGG